MGEDKRNGLPSGTRTFETLEVWKAARTLRRDMTALARTLPPMEKTRLADQMIRASRSVTANIAEGYGRYYFQENIQFCRQGRGSLFELLDHLSVCRDEGYVSQEQFDTGKHQILNAVMLLNGYVDYLKRQKESG
jgi:four helix bundle protein